MSQRARLTKSRAVKRCSFIPVGVQPLYDVGGLPWVCWTWSHHERAEGKRELVRSITMQGRHNLTAIGDGGDESAGERESRESRAARASRPRNAPSGIRERGTRC